MFITVSVLYRPVEQLLSRTIADHDARGVAGSTTCAWRRRSSSRSASLFAVLALAFRGPLQDDLFDGSDTLYWILIATVLAYAVATSRAGTWPGTAASGSTAGWC